jgi:hypothetical protein
LGRERHEVAEVSAIQAERRVPSKGATHRTYPRDAPKGQCLKAQGWPDRAYPGIWNRRHEQPQRGCVMVRQHEYKGYVCVECWSLAAPSVSMNCQLRASQENQLVAVPSTPNADIANTKWDGTTMLEVEVQTQPVPGSMWWGGVTRSPRVVPSAQPWALGHRPVGARTP